MFASGGKASSPDPDVSDALFLAAHPAWTWRDLTEAPARVVGALRLINQSRPS